MLHKIFRDLVFLGILALVGIGIYLGIHTIPSDEPVLDKPAGIEPQPAAARLEVAEIRAQPVAEAPLVVDIGTGMVLRQQAGDWAIMPQSVGSWKASLLNQPAQVLDIGSGYRLVPSGDNYRLQAPSNVSLMAAASLGKAGLTKIDIGSGYQLLQTSEGWALQARYTQSVASWARAAQSAQPVRIEVGCGYALEFTGSNWELVNENAPAAEIKCLPMLIDIGAGNLLVCGEEGCTLVQPAP
jgi:hypothetical protein